MAPCSTAVLPLATRRDTYSRRSVDMGSPGQLEAPGLRGHSATGVTWLSEACGPRPTGKARTTFTLHRHAGGLPFMPTATRSETPIVYPTRVRGRVLAGAIN